MKCDGRVPRGAHGGACSDAACQQQISTFPEYGVYVCRRVHFLSIQKRSEKAVLLPVPGNPSTVLRQRFRLSMADLLQFMNDSNNLEWLRHCEASKIYPVLGIRMFSFALASNEPPGIPILFNDSNGLRLCGPRHVPCSPVITENGGRMGG